MKNFEKPEIDQIVSEFFDAGKSFWSPNCELINPVGCYDLNEFTKEAFALEMNSPKINANVSTPASAFVVAGAATSVVAVGPMWCVKIRVYDKSNEAKYYPFSFSLSYTDTEGTLNTRSFVCQPESVNSWPTLYGLGVKDVNNKRMISSTNVANVTVTIPADQLSPGMLVWVHPYDKTKLNEWKTRVGAQPINVPTRVGPHRRTTRE